MTKFASKTSSFIVHSARHIALLTLVVLLVACGERHQSVTEWLTPDRLESALTCADSARSCRKMIQSLSADGDEAQARLGLLSLMELRHRGDRSDNDSIAEAVVEHYADGDRHLRLLSELLAATTYSELDENDKAVKLFTRAERTAREGASHALLYELYTEWGWTIGSEQPFTESIGKFQQAERHARAMGDHAKVVHAIDLQGWEYLYTEEYDKALRIFDAAIDTACYYGQPNIADLLKSKATALELGGRHAEALTYINEAIAQTRGTGSPTLLAIKGSILTHLHQFDSARVYIERGHQTDHLYQRATYYDDMSRLEAEQGHYREAFNHKTRYATTLDSFYTQDRNQELIKVQRLYNYKLVAAERDRYALDSQRKSTAIAIIVAVIAMLIAVAAVVYQRWRKRISRAIAMKETLLAKTIVQMKDYGYELMRSRQDAQEKEIALTRTLSDRDEQIGHLRDEQQRLKEQLFHTDEVIKKVERIKRMAEGKKISAAKRIALTVDERQSMIASANLCYDRFAERLAERFEGLSTDDLCLCCLLKMGTSAQDQCLLLDINDSTLRKRKYRLKNKKMMLGDDFDTLDSFIATF